MQDDLVMEPAKAYNTKYKSLHEENTNKLFDDLTKKAGVNVEENRDTVKKYRQKLVEIDTMSKKLSRYKVLRGFLIFLIIASILAGAFVGYSSFSTKGEEIPIYVGVIVIVVAVLIVIGAILIIAKKLNKIIKNLDEVLAQLRAVAEELLNLAWSQMATLNSLYDWGMSAKLVEMTVPKLQMDQYLDQEKFEYLREKYGFAENNAQNNSTVLCQTGSILGNPFLLCRDYEQNWVNQTYTGSLTIYWTETVKTQDGYKTVRKSQVLHASIVRPVPSYGYSTYLIYGNDAAPKLSFSRKPSGVTGLSDKEIDKKVKSGAKKLDKKYRDAVKNNSSYTRFGNDEFEVLFGGEDRDNEMEYRLLFTPLAQQNLLKLIKKAEPYGDDFSFVKSKQLNLIQSRHSQGIDYYGNPLQYVDYEYDNARRKFIEYNINYFKGLFFDLAPLLSIPLYQQMKTREYIYDKPLTSNLSNYEHEVLANSFDASLLRPANAATPSIMKTRLISKEGDFDNVEITAHAFEGFKRVTYVSKYGGDGHWHNVPVFWIEYLPIQKQTVMAVEKKNSSRFEYNYLKGNKNFSDLMSKLSFNYNYQRGLFALLASQVLGPNETASINSVYTGGQPTDQLLNTMRSLNQEEIVKLLKSVQTELDDLDTLTKSNQSDDQSATSLLADDSKEAVEVAATEADINETVENNNNEEMQDKIEEGEDE